MEAAIARDADALCKLIDAHFRETTKLILDSGFAGPAPAGRRKRSRLERSPGLA